MTTRTPTGYRRSVSVPRCVGVALAALLAVACEQPVPDLVEFVRPVKMLELVGSEGSVPLEYPAEISATTQAEIAFEVAGLSFPSPRASSSMRETCWPRSIHATSKHSSMRYRRNGTSRWPTIVGIRISMRPMRRLSRSSRSRVDDSRSPMRRSGAPRRLSRIRRCVLRSLVGWPESWSRRLRVSPPASRCLFCRTSRRPSTFS